MSINTYIPSDIARKGNPIKENKIKPTTIQTGTAKKAKPLID